MSGVAERIRAATPLGEHVDVEWIGDRVIASVHLDPALVRGHAEQQGLHHASIATAANATRVQQLLVSAIAGTDATCQIVVPDGHAAVIA